MTGIGQTKVENTLQILSTVEIDDITVEILFHVLPDCYLCHNIMLGREILNQGLAVYMTSEQLKITRALIVNVCNKLENSKTNFDEIDTNISGESKLKLVVILKKFENFFINCYVRTWGRMQESGVAVRGVAM